jgi:hypothetical protein
MYTVLAAINDSARAFSVFDSTYNSLLRTAAYRHDALRTAAEKLTGIEVVMGSIPTRIQISSSLFQPIKNELPGD